MMHPLTCRIREFFPDSLTRTASVSSNTYPPRHAILNPEVEPRRDRRVKDRLRCCLAVAATTSRIETQSQ
jgi:hypothetical protein